MRKRTRVILGFIGVLFVAAIAAFFFFRYQLTKSFPQTTGSVQVPGLIAPVHVGRDAYGVPHIQASNEHDVMLALGYVHAQDRLWQMDMQRRAADGRLSEIFGSRTLPFDRMFRIVGLRRISEALEHSLTPQSRFRLQWYSDGVNAFLAHSKGKYPIEFDLLRYEPDPWQPRHSLLVGRLIAWELNFSWWTELVYGSIVERVGYQKGSEIFPPYPSNVSPAVPASEWRAYAHTPLEYLETARKFLAFSGQSMPASGSNAWAVAPEKSATGSAILANDTHLHLSQPPQWYEVQLFAPGYSTSGMSIPGVPVVVAGRNDSIAWGFTNLMADDADFYVERLDSTDSLKYLADGRWRSMIVQEDEIQVRGQDPVSVSIRLTSHGPVVSDIRTTLTRSTFPFVTSMRWTGADMDDPFDALARVNRATNWKEFTDGLRGFTVPGQNVVYADSRGNIGYYAAARLPIRRTQHPFLPLPGWDPTSEWNGFVPFDELPHMFNPPEGFVASANNKTVSDSYPYYISDLWEPPARIVRLREVLGSPNRRFTPRDMEELQTDTYSQYARELLPTLLAALHDSLPGTPVDKRMMEYFQNWDFRFTKDDIATTIFEQFLVRLLHNIYADEMGEDLFHDFVILVNVPMRVTMKLMAEDTSSWFDDIRTEKVETRDDIIRKSIREALDDLLERYGSDTRVWRWGEMHTVTLQHLLGLQKPLNTIFNVGPYPVSGASTALISGEYSFNEPFAAVVGPSYRMVVDLGNTAEYHAVLPSGQSGQVFHRHYEDQTRLWLDGFCRSVRVNDPGAAEETLIMEPVK